MMDIQTILVIIVLSLFFFFRYRKHRRPIQQIRGPPCPSLLLGHELDLRAQPTVGGLETAWQKAYGNTFRIGGCFAQDILMTSDPKAIQHILRNSGYRYPKTKDVVHIWDMVVGKGLVAVTGSVHQHQRKLLSPAFSSSQLKVYLGVFHATGVKLCGKLNELVTQGPKEVNLLEWTIHAALDIVGLTSFKCQFGALDGGSSEMADISQMLFTAVSKIRLAPLAILVPALWRFLPEKILTILDKVPNKESEILRTFRRVAKETARQTIKNVARDNSRDIVTLLAKASDEKFMDEDEILSQLATFTLGGEDTTAATIAWTLYELSKRPDYQARVREELQKGPAEYESTPLLNAAINETLRLHPIVYTFSRYAAEDDAIPLSEPVRTRTGETWNEIPVEKGQMVMISAYTYNRLSSVWGDNADNWVPERFFHLEGKNRISVGLHANLVNFSDGVHGCIGWKYGLLEVQAILVELLKSLEFLDSGAEVLNGIALISLIPVVKGREQEGVQVPVLVRALSS
ncbi:cytochrome P450 [Desarmillaria tabescens]|uniref:Cytochrome P450 n=1 Tax=Armillaria tabescens TaxID=1929756 RepID=A0AA39MZ43_ARMTA|nr:cytochrome P450 [Desarmillaria tabescens]KAK0451235.1 cytochrome P450 [Desarmillaria tabescens]